MYPDLDKKNGYISGMSLDSKSLDVVDAEVLMYSGLYGDYYEKKAGYQRPDFVFDTPDYYEMNAGSSADTFIVGGTIPYSYFDKYEGIEFVQEAYRIILRREPDRLGRRTLLRLLCSGDISKAEILHDLVNSEEAKKSNISIDGLTEIYAAEVKKRQIYSKPVIGRFARYFLTLRNLNRRLNFLTEELINCYDTIDDNREELKAFNAKLQSQLNYNALRIARIKRLNSVNAGAADEDSTPAANLDLDSVKGADVDNKLIVDVVEDKLLNIVIDDSFDSGNIENFFEALNIIDAEKKVNYTVSYIGTRISDVQFRKLSKLNGVNDKTEYIYSHDKQRILSRFLSSEALFTMDDTLNSVTIARDSYLPVVCIDKNCSEVVFNNSDRILYVDGSSEGIAAAMMIIFERHYRDLLSGFAQP